MDMHDPTTVDDSTLTHDNAFDQMEPGARFRPVSMGRVVTLIERHGAAMSRVPSDNRILYFSRDRESFGFMSHFHPAPIEIDGETWATVEHFYQAQKSNDPAYREAIRNAQTPGAAKRLAAQPSAGKHAKRSRFKHNDASPRSDWNDVKLDIMRRGDHAKFAQHADLAQLLLATGDAELIEDSPTEPFWGTGPDGQGPNWAGRVLMEVRATVRDRKLAEPKL